MGTGMKGDFSDFDCGMVVGDGQVGMSISETTGIFTHSYLYGL